VSCCGGIEHYSRPPRRTAQLHKVPAYKIHSDERDEQDDGHRHRQLVSRESAEPRIQLEAAPGSALAWLHRLDLIDTYIKD
jgi:hypothetical protein